MRPLSLREKKVFEGLCGTVSPEELATLRDAVRQHLGELLQASRRNELLPIDLAEELARRLDDLLEQLGSLAAEARPLVVGAARYFVTRDDVLPDQEGLLGLDDDVAVFNVVARRIGRADLEISG
ncbi:hypothetical protein [Sorangium sp. So ce406]|uniref:hypothetical protein n=1 Tax=Sorangium sp. So ce406 TaxID=3133311 RepID=UPI003F5C3D36